MRRFGLNGHEYDDAEPRFVAVYGSPTRPLAYFDRVMRRWHTDPDLLAEAFAEQGLTFGLPEVGSASAQWRADYRHEALLISAPRTSEPWATTLDEAGVTPGGGALWLLAGDVWDDAGVWDDTETWEGAVTAGQQRIDLNTIITDLPNMVQRVETLEA